MEWLSSFDLLKIVAEFGTCLSWQVLHSWLFQVDYDDVPSQLTEEIAEFCYAVRYVAPNGRTTGSPWSLRQTAVYQQYNSLTKDAIWIFLQPSALMQRRFIDIQRSKTLTGHPAMLHVVILYALAGQWKAYLTYLRHELDSFVGV